MYVITLTKIDTNTKPLHIGLEDCFATNFSEKAKEVYNKFAHRIFNRYPRNNYEVDIYGLHNCDIHATDGLTYHIEIKEDD